MSQNKIFKVTMIFGKICGLKSHHPGPLELFNDDFFFIIMISMYLSNILTLFFCMKTNRNHDINDKSVLTFRHSKKKNHTNYATFPMLLR